MTHCKKCGFPLGVRPDTKDINGVCQACINAEAKNEINFATRQKWLTDELSKVKTYYDCVVAVSGGKDSHMIVRRLIENHGVKNPLLVSVTDEFTHTAAGKHNIDNLVNRYDLDLITFRCKPQTFKKETLKDFKKDLHPLKWIEQQIYKKPVEIARAYGIKHVFYGENSAYDYGTSDKLEIMHPDSTEETQIIFMGAIYPYSITESLKLAREIGFIDLDATGEWPRLGQAENYTQIDSIGYIIQLWTKFVKFGFQRVADVTSRLVREGQMTLKTANRLTAENDYICDPMAKADFCRCVDITEKEFDKIVDKHANKKLVEKIDGAWRLK